MYEQDMNIFTMPTISSWPIILLHEKSMATKIERGQGLTLIVKVDSIPLVKGEDTRSFIKLIVI